MSNTAIPGLPAGLGSVSTPDKVDSRIGTLEFDDGAPSEATAALLYDHLDFVHGVEAFLGALPAASLAAVRRGFLSAGVEDGSFSMFPELMDSASMFLDRELRHDLLLGVPGPERRADGDRRAVDRSAVGDPGHGRRHVVPVGDRRRTART